MSEPFVFDVAFDTSFEQIEKLRKKMLEFVSMNGRDYQQIFDIVVSGTSECSPFDSNGLTVCYRVHRYPGTREDDALHKHHVQIKLAARRDQMFAFSASFVTHLF